MMWARIHRYGVYALAGGALFGAGSVSSTVQFGVPRLWHTAAQVPALVAENHVLKGQATHSKTDSPEADPTYPRGINCPLPQNGWRPPMRDL